MLKFLAIDKRRMYMWDFSYEDITLNLPTDKVGNK